MNFEAVGTRTECITVTLKDLELERILREAYTLDQIVEELMARLEAELLVKIMCSDETGSSGYFKSAHKYVREKYRICDKRKDGYGIFLVETNGEYDYHKDEYDDRYIRKLTPEETEEYDKIQSIRSLIDMMQPK
ncbi:MAG: hypothetical protein ACI4UM_08160 [Succinivibrio sp.]